MASNILLAIHSPLSSKMNSLFIDTTFPEGIVYVSPPTTPPRDARVETSEEDASAERDAGPIAIASQPDDDVDCYNDLREEYPEMFVAVEKELRELHEAAIAEGKPFDVAFERGVLLYKAITSGY